MIGSTSEMQGIAASLAYGASTCPCDVRAMSPPSSDLGYLAFAELEPCDAPLLEAIDALDQAGNAIASIRNTGIMG